jgi:GTP cyclohydrolase IB
MREPRDNIETTAGFSELGLQGMRMPVVVKEQAGGKQRTIATIDVSVESFQEEVLLTQFDFRKIFEDWGGVIDFSRMNDFMRNLGTRLKTGVVRAHLRFPYFLEKAAPISGATSLMEYNCGYDGQWLSSGDLDSMFSVQVPVTTLCPCSRDISDHGAHNQRSLVSLSARFHRGRFLWLEDLVRDIEQVASAEVFALLKRPDEKYLTERAYSRPRFVEDLVREVAMKMRERAEVRWFSIESENFESIHNHSAYASVELTS